MSVARHRISPGKPILIRVTCFLNGIRVAQELESKSWELRSSVSLARLWKHQNKSNEAHDLLAPIYYWFTEGFDTADLKEAKALLEELK